LYSGEAAFIFRNPSPELEKLEETPGSFIGEAYIPGIMQREYLETAKVEDFTAFWLK
jgi:hypothetical protein